MLLRLISVVLYYFIRILNYAILIYCVLSWFVKSGTKAYDIYRKMAYYLEPLFRPAKMILSKLNLNLPIDFSPFLTILFLDIIYRVLVAIIF